MISLRLFVLGLVLAPAAVSAQSGDGDSAKCAATPPPENAWVGIEQGIRSNYAYLEDLPDHDAVLAKAAKRAASATTQAELAAIVHDIGYAYADGHFDARAGGVPYRSPLNSGTDMWVTLEADGRYRIADVKANSDTYKKGLQPGWYVTEVEGQALPEAISDLLMKIVDNPSAEQREFAANVLIAGKRGQEREISVLTPSGAQSITLLEGMASARLGRPDSNAPFTVTDLGEAALVRFHNRLGDNDSIPAFDAAIAGVIGKKAIILDLRDTPSGGNTTVARGIMGHFVSETSPYQLHENTWENVTFGVKRSYMELVSPRGSGFSGKLVVLGGRWTGSVAEAIVIGLDAAAQSHTIGTELANLHGTYNNSGGCFNVGFAYDRLSHVNGTPREDYLPPELLATGEPVAGGDDPGLERARKWLAAHDIKMTVGASTPVDGGAAE